MYFLEQVKKSRLLPMFEKGAKGLEEMRKLFQPLTSRLEITYSNELSMEEILEQVAILPPRSFIVYGQMLVDAAGVVHEGKRAIDRIHAVANAPIFSEQDAFFGRGIVVPICLFNYTSIPRRRENSIATAGLAFSHVR